MCDLTNLTRHELKTGLPRGTPGWRAPENAPENPGEQGSLSKPNDVWGAAVTILHLATSRQPLTRQYDRAAVSAHDYESQNFTLRRLAFEGHGKAGWLQRALLERQHKLFQVDLANNQQSTMDDWVPQFLPPSFWELLEQMLCGDHTHRLTATQIRQHAFLHGWTHSQIPAGM